MLPPPPDLGSAVWRQAAPLSVALIVVVRNLVATLVAEEKGLDQGLARVRDQVVGEEGVPLPAIARVGPPTRGPGNVGLDKLSGVDEVVTAGLVPGRDSGGGSSDDG